MKQEWELSVSQAILLDWPIEIVSNLKIPVTASGIEHLPAGEVVHCPVDPSQKLVPIDCGVINV